MGISNLDPGEHEHRPWNVGSMVGANTIRYFGVDIDDALTFAKRTEI